MDILVLANEQKIGEDIAGQLAYSFPDAMIDMASTDSQIPAKRYDISFVYVSNGRWEDVTSRVIKTSGETYLIVGNDEDITPQLMTVTLDSGVTKVLSIKGIKPELNTICRKYSRMGFRVREQASEAETGLEESIANRNIRKPTKEQLMPIEQYISSYKSLIISVMGAKGGVGKTVTAINLAASLAAKDIGRVGLIDFDTRNSSSVANKLSIQYNKTIRDFIDGINYERTTDVMVLHPAGFYVLPGLYSEVESNAITLDVVEKIIRFTASTLDIVVIDLSAALEVPTLRSMELADIGYIVTDMSRDAFDRMRNWPLPSEILMKQKLIVNKVEPKYKNNFELVMSKLEEEKKIKYLCTIRNDPNENNAWWEDSISILDRRCKTYREDFETVISDVQGYIKKNNTSQPKKRGILGGLLGRG